MAGKIDSVFVELKANVDAAGVVTGEQKIVNSAKKIQNEFSKTDTAITKSSKKIVKANDKSSKSMGRFGRSSGQAGIQLQQFVGQVQGGQNAMLALSQQGADLGIVLGAPLVGAVVGIGASIAGFLIPQLIGASVDTKELVEQIKALEMATKRTAAQNRVLANSNEKEVKTLSDKNQAIGLLIKKEQDLQDLRTGAGVGTDTGEFAIPRSAADNQIKFADAIEKSRLKLDDYRATIDTNNQAIINLSKNTSELGEQSGDTAKLLKQQVAIATIDINEGADAARRLALAFELGLANAEALPVKVREQLTALEEVEAKQKVIAESERAEALKTSKFKAALLAEEARQKTERGSNLDKLRQDIMEEGDLLKLKSKNELLLLESSLLAGDVLRDEADEIRKIKAQQLEDALLAIKTKAADADARIEAAKERTKLNAISGMFGDLSSLMNTESRKLFEIGKAAALSGAIVDGYAAVQSAIKVGNDIGGPPLGAAFGAAAAIQTAVQVKGIAKQKFGGGGGGATSFSGGVPAVNTQQAAPQQTQTVDVRVTASGGGVVDMFNFEVANGASPIMG